MRSPIILRSPRRDRQGSKDLGCISRIKDRWMEQLIQAIWGLIPYYMESKECASSHSFGGDPADILNKQVITGEEKAKETFWKTALEWVLAESWANLEEEQDGI
eukprot:5463152-Ditylum_brightwellii.AAC.1